MRIPRPNTTYSIGRISRWIWDSSRDNRLQAILNTSIGLLDVVLALLSVWTVQRAIDIASHHLDGDVIMAVVWMALVISGTFVLDFCSTWVKNYYGVRAQNRMQRRMLGHILHSEFQGRNSMHSGDVINRLESDVNTVVNFVAETIPNAVSVFCLFVGAFVYLYSLDSRLAIIIVIMFPLFLLVSKIYVSRMRELSRDVRNSDSMVQSLLQESIQNRILVKTLEGEDTIIDKLTTQHDTLHRKVIRRTKFSVFSSMLVSIGFASGYIVAFAWGALRLAAGTLTYGGMSAFLQLVNRVQRPARALTNLAPQFVSVFTAAERLMILEDVPLEKQGKQISLTGPCGIAVRNVTFAYPDNPDKVVINNLSFDFKPGTCTAVIGETGAGKTTLIRMILALLKPVEGSVNIYNVEKDIPVSPQTRCNIIYVPQGNTMMSGTIRENLQMGNVDATDAEMYEALDTACADFVRSLPDGLDTAFSEQGGGLSEGQAQRICVARALLRNCPLMILDEATSALDSETEKKLLNNLLTDKSRTIIFITHRQVVLDYCDDSLHLIRKRQ
ncbi:MAG: ABC transporter ATP-binding protein [Prevotella sp.]|nr:ABC transporter ATP-binding protein [Prevotella sp.]